MSYFVSLISRDFQAIPPQIKRIVFLISVWFFAWGMIDPLWSIYLKSIVNDYALVGMLAASFHLVAMFIAIPLGQFEDSVSPLNLIRKALFVYVFTWCFYYLAGIFQSVPLLILTLFINGFASPMVIMSTRTFIKKESPQAFLSRATGLFTMVSFVSYAFGMFFNSIFNHFYSLNSMFFSISFFSFILFFLIQKVPNHWKPNKITTKTFFSYLFSFKIYKKTWLDIRKYNFQFYHLLLLIFFIGVVEQLILIFIPLLALKLKLNFSEISILMGVMYLPYLFTFFFAEMADRYERMTVASIGLIFASAPMFFIYYSTNSYLIAILSTLIALSLALINPATEGAITSMVSVQKRGEITGVQTLCRRMGMFIGPLVLGFVAENKGINFVFLLVAIISIILGIVSIWLKIYAHTKNEIHLFNQHKLNSVSVEKKS